MRKKVKLLLAFIVMSVFFPPAVSAFFPDVFASNPFSQAINYVQTKGIVAGYPNGLFEPERPINRAEFTKILIKTRYNENQISSCSGSTFKDVDGSAWYAPYVCKARQDGVVGGYADGTFQPENNVNFAEAAKILVKTLRNDELEAGQYASDIWYAPYIHVLADNGALPLAASGPDVSVTRALMAELIYRLSERKTSLDSYSFEEFGDRAVIEGYYQILGWDSDKAYGMKIDATMGLDEFKKMYPQDTANYSIANFTRTGEHTYDFYIWSTFPPNINSKSALYHFQMKVIGGKLKTISANPASSLGIEDVKYDETLSAKIVWENGIENVYVLKDGLQTLAFSIDAAESFLRNLKFAGTGHYLTFHVYGWEFGGVYLYDTVNNKLAEGPFFGQELYGYASNEKYFYFCSPSGMSSGEAKVLNLPGFQVRRNLAVNASIESCSSFDANNDYLVYSLLDESSRPEKHVYDIVNDVDSIQ